MERMNVHESDRAVVEAARKVQERTNGAPAAAIELPNGKMITGKTSDLLGCSSAMLLNALKELAGIDSDVELISPSAIQPIQRLKLQLGGVNPRLHTDEMLFALSITASTQACGVRGAYDNNSFSRGRKDVPKTRREFDQRRRLFDEKTCQHINNRIKIF